MKDIYWIEDDRRVRLAIVARPRGDDWLESDLRVLKSGGIDVLISLIEENEAQELGLAHEEAAAQQLGMGFLSYPIPDRRTPSDGPGFVSFVARIATLLREGRAVGVHCRGCIGRATVLTSALLIALGASAEEALRSIEAARGCPVPDTPEQRAWIMNLQIARVNP